MRPPLSIVILVGSGIVLVFGAVTIVIIQVALAVVYAWVHRTPIRSFRDLLRLRKVWAFPLADCTRTVTLEHWYLSGRRSVFVDGHLVRTGRKLFDTGDRLRFFAAADHPCTLVFRAQVVLYRYNLAVDGRWLEPVPSPVPLPTPIWVCLFVGLCGAIPVLSWGGTVSTGLAFAGMLTCITAARAQQPAWKRLAICTAATLICWGLFFWMVFTMQPGSELYFFS